MSEALVHNELVISAEGIAFRQATDDRQMFIDLKAISLAEARIEELSCITPTKAPELLAAFTTAWRDLDKLVSIMAYQHVVAATRAKEIRARCLVDSIAELVKESGLPNSKDVRDALLDGLPEVQKAIERQQQIHCILELVKGKKEAIGMAYSAAKRIVGEGAYNMLRNTANPNFSDGEGNVEVPKPNRPVTKSLAAFGNPRY